MAELKPETPHGSLWSSYSGSAAPLSTRFSTTMGSGIPQASTDAQQQAPGRPRAGQAPVDHSYQYPRYHQEDHDGYDRQPQPQSSLAQHNSYSQGVKRSFSQVDQPPYQEIVQDLRDEGSKLTVNHDHKLLSFRKVPDKHAIVDQQGRMHQLELSAQLHGMFFLSEMPSNGGESGLLQPELTCYRRNLFQISGSLITPRGQLSVVLAETGETVPVSTTEVTVSAIESVDGHPVRLIVIPWKTPPPNSPELPQAPDQEPASLPLIPFQDDGGEGDGEFAVYPIGWRRLQFRIATANNGRRKELQQHFVVHLKVVATLANGSKVVMAEAATAPIVVRGRSPRNFQARKEIPLLGSSAGSRGQALVETGLGIIAGPISAKPQETKVRALNLELPRTAFTFNATKLPGSPMTMRSNSYPSWNPHSSLPLTQMPTSATATFPPTSLAAEPYQKLPLAGVPNYGTEAQETSLPTSMPAVSLSLAANEPQSTMRTPYAYAPGGTGPSPLAPSGSAMGGGPENGGLNVPRYVEHDSRPSKSPRHAAHQSVHSSSSITNNEAAEYRYGSSYGSLNHPSGELSGPGYNTAEHPSAGHGVSQPPREYYPPSSTWTTTAGEPHASIPTYQSPDRAYAYSDHYKTGHNVPPLKTDHPQTTNSYANSLGHYSWSPT